MYQLPPETNDDIVLIISGIVGAIVLIVYVKNQYDKNKNNSRTNSPSTS